MLPVSPSPETADGLQVVVASIAPVVTEGIRRESR